MNHQANLQLGLVLAQAGVPIIEIPWAALLVGSVLFLASTTAAFFVAGKATWPRITLIWAWGLVHVLVGFWLAWFSIYIGCYSAIGSVVTATLLSTLSRSLWPTWGCLFAICAEYFLIHALRVEDEFVLVLSWNIFVSIGLWMWASGARGAEARERHGRGLCVACGYEMSGLAPLAACPECGWPRGPRAPDPERKQNVQPH